MIDVKTLIAKYTVEELIETADEYYKSMNLQHLAIKPFRIPEANHLLVELAYLIYGLDIRPGDRVLDFGCGTGWTSRILHACGCHVIGVDVSETALGAARVISDQWHSAGLHNPYGDSTLEYRRFDGHRLPVEDHSVAKIVVLDAFHHVPRQADVLREFGRVLTPGGVAGFCEPGPRHSQNPDSQREMSLHKVIENDIVLEEIFQTAKSFGFEDLKICLSPLHPVMVSHSEYSAFPKSSAIASRYLSITDSRVKNYPIFFLKMSGTAPLDSRSNNGLRARLELPARTAIAIESETAFEIPLKVTNVGQATWLPSGTAPGAVNIGMIATSSGGQSVQFRSHLSHGSVEPGTQLTAIAHFGGLEPGEYDIEIDLVSEHIGWFKDFGTRELHVKATVK